MKRLIICLTLSLTYISLYGETKKEQIESAICQVKDIASLYKVKDILDRYDMSRHIPFHFPISGKYRISSPYGYRTHPISGKRSFHTGVDIAVELATPVYAAADGVVTYASLKGGYGRCVVIRHKYGYTTLYGHLIAYYTTKGDYVKKGDAIGFVGSTGNSTGNHLHYEIRKSGKPIKPICHEYK